MSTDPSPTTSGPVPEGPDRRASDRWTPPISAIRDVRHIVVLDVLLLVLLIGTLLGVVPGTVEAQYGMVEGYRTAVHLGPALLMVIAAVLALVSVVAGIHAISTGHPVIARGVSSASGRSAHRTMRAALLTAVLAFVQLLVFAMVLPPAL